jgi:hypothetical protein
VAIGGAGIALSAPAAALLVNPGVAQAAPPPASDPLCPLFGSCMPASVGSTVASLAGPGNLADPFGVPTAFFGLAGAIPIVNVFIGNGGGGTAVHPVGFNGGIFAASPCRPGASLLAGGPEHAAPMVTSGGALARTASRSPPSTMRRGTVHHHSAGSQLGRSKCRETPDSVGIQHA